MRVVLALASAACLLAAPSGAQAQQGAVAASATAVPRAPTSTSFAATNRAAVEQPRSAKGATTSSVLSLSDAWRAALENDPTYQAAISEREAGQTNRAMGRAGLLPQVSASLGRNKIRGTLDTPTPQGGVVSTDLDYMSKTNEIRATQSVFNWSRIADYRQGNARADYSLAVFDTRAKDTAVRLINRYFQALLSYENVVLSQSYLEANEKQIQAAQRRFDSGEGTITDVRETSSRRDLARADLIQAQDALVVARRELQEMVGVPPTVIMGLSGQFKTRPLSPTTLEGWLSAAMSNNAEIRAGIEAVRISEREIDRTFGGHLPTLDIVASRRLVENETISTRNQDSNTNSFGVQIALPIFSGGLTSAQVSQARHNRDRAEQELSATRERIAVEVTRQYQGVVSGAERIAALVVAVESSAAALTAVERGYEAGTRSIVDILDAQDQLYRSRLELTQARLQYVLARLMLSGAAGTLDAGAIDTVTNAYFDGLKNPVRIDGGLTQIAAGPRS